MTIKQPTAAQKQLEHLFEASGQQPALQSDQIDGSGDGRSPGEQFGQEFTNSNIAETVP